ncbi:MAG: hypothetical protein ABIA93_00025 [Candidatus Woesearchaeota archaeon]
MKRLLLGIGLTAFLGCAHPAPTLLYEPARTEIPQQMRQYSENNQLQVSLLDDPVKRAKRLQGFITNMTAFDQMHRGNEQAPIDFSEESSLVNWLNNSKSPVFVGKGNERLVFVYTNPDTLVLFESLDSKNAAGYMLRDPLD